MFCVNCGTKLVEDASFCTNCGNAVVGAVKKEKVKEKVVDNKIQLSVKPVFKLWYMIIPYIVMFIVLMIPIVGVLSIFSEVTNGAEIIGKTMAIMGLLIVLLMTAILIFVKKQYDAYNYDFYKSKVIYRDSFISISEKEVKYKHIREVYLRRGLFQRMFNLGTIVLYTNAETGYASGIYINNIESPEEEYIKIKELLDAQD